LAVVKTCLLSWTKRRLPVPLQTDAMYHARLPENSLIPDVNLSHIHLHYPQYLHPVKVSRLQSALPNFGDLLESQYPNTPTRRILP
jgi:hypothetical protein